MILRALLLSFSILSFVIPLQAQVWDSITNLWRDNKPSPPQMTILVAHDVEAVDLEVKGKYSLYDPFKQSYLSTRFAGKRRILQAMSDGLKWGEAFPGLYQLQIKPEDVDTVIFVENRPYIGSVSIYDIGGTVSLIDQVPVETYLASILSQHERLRLHPETWAALVIAARTNAYFQVANPKNAHWAVDAQKVGFVGQMRLLNPDLDRAIAATRYMIMSQTGIYEKVVTPFPLLFGPLNPGAPYKGVVTSRISLEEADQLAQEGEHAAQILARAFPGATIMLMQDSSNVR